VNEIIARKKAGKKLSAEDIQKFVAGATTGDIPDYQISALLMAICFRGMDITERALLTQAMAKSGRQFNFDRVPGLKVDKHSTGGVGDKTSLVLAPWLAAAGRKIPMISGRGLGFTGGTLDKLAAIPGYSIEYSEASLTTMLLDVGCFVIGQTADIAPADKKLYALRDVTATVDEISLITASILSKKLAEGLDELVMDVKCGSGAFMQNLRQARELAASIAATAKSAGVHTTCLITAMDFPLGRFTGNTAETHEAYEFCKPEGKYIETARAIFVDKRRLTAEQALIGPLVEITCELAIAMYDAHAGKSAKAKQVAFADLLAIWSSGALERQFARWVETQHGDLPAFERKASEILSGLQSNSATETHTFISPREGYLTACNSMQLGNLMVDLGAGRKKSTDIVSDEVTLEMLAARGTQLRKGQPIMRVYKKEMSPEQKKQIDAVAAMAFAIGRARPKAAKNILARI
jgi:pyrimidine-nucleoside phosphorylase